MKSFVPVISEKSFAGSQKSIYTFRVPQAASKIAIKGQLEAQFGVTIINVNTSQIPAKTRRRGRIVGQKPGYKKAIVTLKKGEKIKELDE